MLKTEDDCGGSGGGGNGWARVCDTCRSEACTVYCRADSAYLCNGCDLRIHAANQVASRHERVWVCEACERAPAAFICKADAASLCATCDADIHSANPLARRHHRVPIMPISGCVYGASSAVGPTADTHDGFFGQEEDETIDENDEDETASWLLLNPVKGNITPNTATATAAATNNDDDNQNQSNGGFLFGGEVDEYLNFVEFNSCGDNHEFGDQYSGQQQQHNSFPAQKNHGGDSVVPVRFEVKDQLQHHHHHHHQQQQQNYQLSSGYSFNGFISHSASVSSMEVGVVPESTVSDLSISNARPPKGTIDLFSGPPIQMAATQLTPMDREARVLRYREKKKARKFEKTIRYASRKAYAETRPRIKGRFAKRSDVEVEVDQKFSNSLMAETGYGLVPSF